MIPLDVPSHGAEGGEGLPAVAEEAAKGPLLGMGPQVRLEVDGLAEIALAAREGALEGPVGIVGQLVGLQVAHRGEGLSALADEGALPGVGAHVGPQVRGGGEGPSAAGVVAAVLFRHRFLSPIFSGGLDLEVNLKKGGEGERSRMNVHLGGKLAGDLAGISLTQFGFLWGLDGNE